MKLDDFISIDDQRRVVDAIGDAEKQTSGEIRVHLTPKCGDDVMKDAIKTFNRLKMYKTRHRNGVLIFMAFESRKFAIQGGRPHHRLVPSDCQRWRETESVLPHRGR